MQENSMSESLCKICRALHRTTKDFEQIELGTVADIQSKHACPICRIVLCMLLPGLAVENSMQQHIPLSPQRVMLRKMGRAGFIIWQGDVIRGELDYFFPGQQIDSQSNWWFPFKDTVYDTLGTLDYVKMKDWVAECDADHVRCKAVHSRRSMQVPVQTYFIDTQDNCLVHRDSSVRYLALSYVWGNAVTFKATCENCNALQQPGAFKKIEPLLSPVIRDAIEVSRRLGERYLWIDALCIPQDDEICKARLIAQMDSIYTQAFLTIVALGANSADSPLSGVRPGTRSPNIANAQVAIGKTEERLPNKYTAIRPSVDDVLRNGSYNSRAWTFQESCLSRRCLIFTDHGMFFHCDSVLRSDSRLNVGSDAWPQRNVLLSVFETREESLDVGQQYNVYTRLVSDFSKRKLKYPEDTLKAISGIFAILSSRFGWHFEAGMPSHLIDHALLWRSASTDQTRNPHFPSWSWAGWSGWKHWNFQTFLDPLWIESDIRSAPLVSLQSKIEILQEHHDKVLTSPKSLDGIQIPVLHINAETVRGGSFRLTPSKPTCRLPSEIPISPYREIWTADGLRCGILYDFQGEINAAYEFIALSLSKWTIEKVISRGRKYGEHFTSWFGHVCDDKTLACSEFCLVNVILAVIGANGSERVGIGLIHNDVWQKVIKVRENLRLR